MRKEKFKVGDQVQLKSGGPIMTVSQIEGGRDGIPVTIRTVWWAKEISVFQKYDFWEEVLRHVPG